MSRLRALASDTLIYGLSTFLGRFLTFLLTPIYTNYLSKVEFGDVVNLYSYIAFLNIVYSFGLEAAFLRFFPKDDQAEGKKVFSTAFLAILAISGFTSLLLILGAGFIARTDKVVELPEGAALIRYAAIIAFSDALTLIPYALLRMTRRPKKFAMTKFAVIIVNVAMNFLLVMKFRMGASGVLYAGIISSVFGVLVLLGEYRNYFRFSFDRNLFREMWKFGLPTVPAAFSAIMLQVIDRPIMKALTDASTLAVYQANYRLSLPMMMTVTMFEYAWKPFYLSHAESPDAKQLFARVLTYFTFIAGIVFLLTAFFIEFIVRMPFFGGRFINPQYWYGLSIIPVVLAGYYFNGISTNLAAGFHITKETKYLSIATGIAALTNIILNFILIPHFTIWGGAWATLGAYLLGAVALYYFARKVYPLDYDWRRVSLLLMLSMGIYGGTILAEDTLGLGFDSHFLGKFFFRLGATVLFFVLVFALRIFGSAEIGAMKRIILRR